MRDDKYSFRGDARGALGAVAGMITSKIKPIRVLGARFDARRHANGGFAKIGEINNILNIVLGGTNQEQDTSEIIRATCAEIS